MKQPNIKTKVVHSESKTAWNVVSIELGSKYKIARCPYHVCDIDNISEMNRKEALQHAKYISYCFNM